MSINGVSATDSGNFKFPVHVARAYNIPSQRGAQSASTTQSTSPISTQRASEPAKTDQVSVANSQRIVDTLVAAQVDSSAAPWVAEASSQQPQLASAAGAFPLYRRAADRIEAAVGIAVGKSLDVKG